MQKPLESSWLSRGKKLAPWMIAFGALCLASSSTPDSNRLEEMFQQQHEVNARLLEEVTELRKSHLRLLEDTRQRQHEERQRRIEADQPIIFSSDDDRKIEI